MPIPPPISERGLVLSPVAMAIPSLTALPERGEEVEVWLCGEVKESEDRKATFPSVRSCRISIASPIYL